MKLISMLWLVFVPSALAQNPVDDVVARANRSSFIPNVSVRYSYRSDHPQWIWAAFSWEFDEANFSDRTGIAIEIKWLERERERLIMTMANLDMESVPSVD